MCRRQMFLGRVSYVKGSWSDCGQAQVVQVLCLVAFCVSVTVFSHIFPCSGLHMHGNRLSAYRWPPELLHLWKACSSPPRSCSWARTHGCPGPRGATFSSGRHPGRRPSHPAGWWPLPESHQGPGVPEFPPQSSSASHTVEKIESVQSRR